MTTDQALRVSNIALLLGAVVGSFASTMIMRARRDTRDLIQKKDDRIREIYASGFAEIEKRDVMIDALTRENIQLLKCLGERVP